MDGTGYAELQVTYANNVIESLHIPTPNPSHVLGAESAPQLIGAALQTYANYLARLEWQIGNHESWLAAIKDAYEGEIAMHMAKIETKETNAAKEARILAGSEELRRTRAAMNRQQVVLHQLRGLRDGYKHLYDAASRLLTVRQIETSVQVGRQV